LTVEHSAGTGIFSDVGGQGRENSLVLEVQEMRNEKCKFEIFNNIHEKVQGNGVFLK